ncbi:hypothetical protein [Gemmatimonas sp.]|uniref:hypothetical protein n=1 Tax=Gemmatimonas sp. TaxID=1962908 RepID=UPI00356674FC
MLGRALAVGVLSLLTISSAGSLRAQPIEKQDLTPNSELSLVAESNGLRPGATTTVALRIMMEKGWHTYWTNPGDAGLPLAACRSVDVARRRVRVGVAVPCATRDAAAAARQERSP